MLTLTGIWPEVALNQLIKYLSLTSTQCCPFCDSIPILRNEDGYFFVKISMSLLFGEHNNNLVATVAMYGVLASPNVLGLVLSTSHNNQV